MSTTNHAVVLAALFALLPLSSVATTCNKTPDTELNTEASYWQRLEEIRAARAYPTNVTRGSFNASHKVEGSTKTFHYTVDVPDSYDPQRQSDLHIFLHGGVGLSGTRITNVKLRRLRKQKIEDSISVYPSAFTSAKWWYEIQPKNILKIINTLKQSYNIDENRIFIHGISDGGSGAYYFASHFPTPFAGFVAFVGSPHVLREKHHVYGTTFPGNFVNKPIFAVNAHDDHWFPVESVERLFAAVNDAGGDIEFHPVSGDHFGTPWLGSIDEDRHSFLRSRTRNPYPDYLYWQIDEGGEYKRIHWLVLHGTNGADNESAVAAQKIGNAIHIGAKNVSAVTLLISSDHFDLNSNVQIWSNDKLLFDEKVEPDVQVLNKWHALDQDTTMLFASEICLDTF